MTAASSRVGLLAAVSGEVVNRPLCLIGHGRKTDGGQILLRLKGRMSVVSNLSRIAGGLVWLQTVKPDFGIVRDRFEGEVAIDLAELPHKHSGPFDRQRHRY